MSIALFSFPSLSLHMFFNYNVYCLDVLRLSLFSDPTLTSVVTPFPTHLYIMSAWGFKQVVGGNWLMYSISSCSLTDICTSISRSLKTSWYTGKHANTVLKEGLTTLSNVCDHLDSAFETACADKGYSFSWKSYLLPIVMYKKKLYLYFFMCILWFE